MYTTDVNERFIIHEVRQIYSCFASFVCFAKTRLLVSFSSECVYSSTILDGAMLKTALISEWDQYGVMVPGAIFASTERT